MTEAVSTPPELTAWQKQIVEQIESGQEVVAIVPRFPDKTAAIALLRACAALAEMRRRD